ncbi:MAG: hypothetical protein HFG41_00590 [Coprococcus sp.]|nr:hypothetical protein [Coprococcus sp.]
MESKTGVEWKDEVKMEPKITRNFYNLDMDLDKIVQGVKRRFGISKRQQPY